MLILAIIKNYSKNEKIVNEINELVRKHKAGVIPVKSNLED